MLSLLLPPKINLSVAPGFIKLEGPNGSFLKTIGSLKCHIVENHEGSRLFIEGDTSQEESTALAHISQLCTGLSRGYRRRLRLMGVGFRAVRRDVAVNSVATEKSNTVSTPFFTKTYRRKRRLATNSTSNTQKVLSLKIGFSHEFSYPLNIAPDVKIQASRLEGRSKGTIISLQGKDSAVLNQVAAEIRAFRFPDAYKGKGIHYDREVLKLKKGKRQG